MLLAWKDAGHLHLRRLHPRLSRTTRRIDPARHRDHPARVAGRHARVLHPDAAARLGGPSKDVDARASRWTPTSTTTTSSTSVSDHPKMSRAEWQAIYHEAWTCYYSRAHIETLLRRAAATGVPLMRLIKAVVPFIHMAPVENIHPLQAGLFRRKHRYERRYGLPRKSVWAFYSTPHLQHDRAQPEACENHPLGSSIEAPHRTRSQSPRSTPTLLSRRCTMTTKRRSTS